MGWSYPLASTSNYDRVSNQYKSGHYATDLANTYGSSPMGGKAIYAPQEDVVEKANYSPEADGYVIIRTKDWDPYTLNYLRVGYYHLQDPRGFLTEGQTIKKSQIIGYVLGGTSNVHTHAFVTNNGAPFAPANNTVTTTPGTLNFARFFPNVGFERKSSYY